MVVLPKTLEQDERIQGELHKWSLCTVKGRTGRLSDFHVHGLSTGGCWCLLLRFRSLG